MRRIILLLLLVALPVEGQQISRPPVGTTGPIGQGGSFPFFNSGTITMSDADYTMVFPDMSASVIRVVGTLSQTRNIIAPAGSLIGFEFTIINATTGGHSVVLKSAAGTGATVPNGQALLVVYDGTNYVSVGAAGGTGPATGGFGNIVPSPFATIQAALSAGGGPVIVLPSSTDRTPYNNLTNMRIQNYKQNPGGADSLFFRDVSEWGPIDGNVIGCTTTAGSNAVTCGVQWVNAPAPAGDVGKLIIIPQAGAGTYGQVTGTITASRTGLTAGTPNTIQGITFTDAGDCYSNSDGTPNWNTQPYGHIQLDASGLPTGNVQFFNFTGKGCTHPPTRGTIATVGGTVTFTGGSMARGDLVSTIASVTAGTGNATLADNATYASGAQNAYYGTDAYQTLQTACNNVSTGGFLTNGTLTFSGMALISHGIDCSAAGLRLLGRAPHGLASALIYAGKTPNNMMNGNVRATGGASASAPLVPNAYVLNLAQGGAAKVERIHILGNSQAMPYGIMLSFGSACYGNNGTTDCFQAPGTGSFIDQMHVIDQVTLGAFWGDPIADLGTPRLQSCIFWAGFTGNADFTMLDRIYCYGADTGMDSVNDQATDLKIGKWSGEFGNIGMSTSGGIFVDDYYTEYNRADIVMGSPYWPGGFPEFTEFKNYGGESSGMDFGGMGAGAYNCYSLIFDNGGLGGPSYFRRPDGISADFVNSTPSGGPASTTCLGWIKWGGESPGNILIPNSFEGGPWNNMEFDGNFTIKQFRFPAGTCVGNCYATGGWGLSNNYIKINGFNLDFSVPNNTADWMTPYLVPTPGEPYLSVNLPALLDVKPKSQITIGSLNLQGINWGSGPGIGYGTGPNQICNGVVYPAPGPNPGTPCGSTTYQYQLTCSDSLGNESTPTPAYSAAPSTIMVTNTGPLPLNSTNYNIVSSWIRPGCDTYNLYGDNGVGGTIGYLASLQVGGFAQTITFSDQGQWTKNTARVPPTVNGVGSLSLAGRLQLKNLLSAPGLGTDAQGNVIATSGGGPGGGGSVTSVGLTDSTGLFSITGSPVTTAGTLNLAGFQPQGSTFVLAGPSPGTAGVQPAVVQWRTCSSATVSPITCTFATPTQAGHMIIVAPSRYNPAGSAPPFAGRVVDNLGQTYTPTPSYPPNPISYKENSAAGVTSITWSGGNGGVITIFEVSDIAASNSYDADSYNVVQLPGPPIQWEVIVPSFPNDFILAYWNCAVNSTTAPTASPPWNLGGYTPGAPNGTAGWVWQVTTGVGTFIPAVATADCTSSPTSPNAFAVAFKASLISSSAPATFRPLTANDLPVTPWSAIGNPVPNYLTQLNMGTGMTIWSTDIGATGIPNRDWGFGLLMSDISTHDSTCYNYAPEVENSCRSMLYPGSSWPGVFPFEADACGATNSVSGGQTCNGFHVSGATGDIVMQANAGIMLPNPGGQIVSAGAITSDTSVSAPAFFTCTTANPCITPNPAIAPLSAGHHPIKPGSVVGQGPVTDIQSRGPAPAGRLSGGEPLASLHLHDFSATKPTNGQVPIFNASLGVYVPGTVSGGGASVSLDAITAATNTNTLGNGLNFQTWNWALGNNAWSALTLGETTAATNANANILRLNTLAGSNASPLRVTARGATNGFRIDGATGNLVLLGTAKVQLTGLNNATSLATDATGAIIAGTGGGAGGPIRWDQLLDPTAGGNWNFGGNRFEITLNRNAGQAAAGIKISDNTSGSFAVGPGMPFLFSLDSNSRNAIPLRVDTFDGTATPALSGGWWVNPANGDFTSQYESRIVAPVQLLNPGSASAVGTPVANAPSLATDANGNIIRGGAGEYCHNYNVAAAPGPGPTVVQTCVPTLPLVVGGHYRITGSVIINTTSAPMTPTFSINQGGAAGQIICDTTRVGVALVASQSYYGTYECEFTVTGATEFVSFGGPFILASLTQQKSVGFIPINPGTMSTSSPLSIDLVAQTLSTGATLLVSNLLVYRVY